MGHLPRETMLRQLPGRCITPGIEHRRPGAMTPTPGMGIPFPTLPGHGANYGLAHKVTRWTSATRTRITPHWSSENAISLAPEGREHMFEGKVELLDRNCWKSVHSAVEALNSGVLNVEVGYCIVFSESRRWYFLLRRDDKESEALAALPSEIFRPTSSSLNFATTLTWAPPSLSAVRAEPGKDSMQALPGAAELQVATTLKSHSRPGPTINERPSLCAVTSIAERPAPLGPSLSVVPAISERTAPLLSERTAPLAHSLSAVPKSPARTRAPPVPVAVPSRELPAKQSLREALRSSPTQAVDSSTALEREDLTKASCSTSSARRMWSTDRCALLGTDVSCLEQLLDGEQEVLLLGKARMVSVTMAVTALNAGSLVADSGFCVVFSKAKSMYCLVWRADKDAKLIQYFPGLPWQQATPYLRMGPDGYQLAYDFSQLNASLGSSSSAPSQPLQTDSQPVQLPFGAASRKLLSTHHAAHSPREEPAQAASDATPGQHATRAGFWNTSFRSPSPRCAESPTLCLQPGLTAPTGEMPAEPLVPNGSPPLAMAIEARLLDEMRDHVAALAARSQEATQADSCVAPVPELNEETGDRGSPVLEQLEKMDEQVVIRTAEHEVDNAAVLQESLDKVATHLNSLTTASDPGHSFTWDSSVESPALQAAKVRLGLALSWNTSNGHGGLSPIQEPVEPATVHDKPLGQALGSSLRENMPPTEEALKQTVTKSGAGPTDAPPQVCVSSAPRRHSSPLATLRSHLLNGSWEHLISRSQSQAGHGIQPRRNPPQTPATTSLGRLRSGSSKEALGLEVLDLNFKGEFDMMSPALQVQLFNLLDLGPDTFVEELSQVGGLNLGVWAAEDSSSQPRRSLALKLVQANRHEADRFVTLARDHPALVSDSALAFPLRVVHCIDAVGAKQYDLIVMPKVPGVLLSLTIGSMWWGNKGPALMQLFEEIGYGLAEFHRRYAGKQHGDFQPSNIVYDGTTGTVTYIDLVDIGPEGTCVDNDCKHFLESLRLVSKAYGSKFLEDAEKHFRLGYAKTSPST